MKSSRVRVTGWVLLLLLLASLASAQAVDWGASRTLSPGLQHLKLVVDDPRPMRLNCLRIDTQTPGLHFRATGRYDDWVADVSETKRQTTRNFLLTSQESDRKLVAAINANFFSPWPAPWNEETIGNLIGLAMEGGEVVSPASGGASFLVMKDGTVALPETPAGFDCSQVETAVTGSGFVLLEGKSVGGGEDVHPRTAIGLSQDARYVYFLVVDGRQLRSFGAKLGEVGEWLAKFGAWSGLNLDGGGSTSMVWWNTRLEGNLRAELLNYPVGSGSGLNFKYTERCNGNNLGVWYEAEQASE